MSARSGFNNRTTQKKFVPKIRNSPNQNQNQNQNPIQTPNLSTSLRSPDHSAINPPSSSSSSSSSPALAPRVQKSDNGDWISTKKQTSGRFVNYLPQDEAVAAGLGAEDGALDAVESQRVVDLLNRELSRLLKLNPRDFWKEAVSEASLHDFLDSFLQFRSRWYDFSRQGVKGLVAGVIVGELELSRRVFMVFYRISSNRDPGARASDSLSVKEHGAILQEKKLLHLPKLLDICAIYGHENEDLTRVLVTSAMKAQPWLHENLWAVVSKFLSIANTMHQRCDSLLEAIFSSAGQEDRGDNRLHVDFLEVMEFINDAVASLDAFVNAYKPAAVYFSCPVETSYESGELLGTLAKLHDLLLPSLQRGFVHILGSTAGADADSITTNLRTLSMRVVNLAWKLLDCCYLSNEVFEGSLPLLNATKMFPADVEDPVIRGDILVQTFREINEVSNNVKRGTNSRSLLRNVEKTHKILSKFDELLDNGWIALDNEQFQFLSLILNPPAEAMKKESNMPVTVGDKVQMDESAVIIESKISQIKDIFPDYGNGFLAACLEAYNQNPEEVIQRILEGTLHKELQAMDVSLDKIPPPKSSTLSRNDKGKGIVDPPQSPLTAKVVERRTEGTSSSSPSLVGRFTRKPKVESPGFKILDSKGDEDYARTLSLAAQYEYEDEYDDSFDDLGLSFTESEFEETESLSDRVSSSVGGKSGGAGTESSTQPNKAGSKWKSNAQKKPQFYVKDGKNYSYKVADSVGVMDSREAALVNLSQKELINGLGRGGNLPMGAVKALGKSSEEQDEQESDCASEMGGGRGNQTGFRGRGRRGGGNNYRKDRAMKKHFAGLGGF